MIDFIANNWLYIVIAIAVIAFAAIQLYNFIKLPHSAQIAKVKEWLLWAVTKAEKELGGGTGALKLRYVYDMFVAKFPLVAKFLKFETFSGLVDQALEKMRELLETNEKVEAYVSSPEEE